jgi:glycosyltransferase involved in cell wall biosynthesis
MVSVIVPVYNAGKYLAQTLDSVLAQTFSDWECLMVDDGSTDDSPLIAREYAARDSRFRYIRRPNGGVAAARNTGLDAARGDYVALLDNDDLWLPRKLEVAVGELGKGDADLFFSRSYRFSGDLPPADVSRLPIMKAGEGVYRGAEGISAFLIGNRIQALTAVAKREALIDAGGFVDRGGADDYNMWLELLFRGRTLRGIDTPLALYRWRGDAQSSGDRFTNGAVLPMLREYRERFPDTLDYSPAARKWLRRYLKRAYRRGGERFIAEQIRYWGLETASVRCVIDVSRFIPAWMLKHLLRTLL